MHIALSVTEFPAVSQTFVLDHVVGLLERGHKVELHALRPGSLQVQHADIERYGLLAQTHYTPSPLIGTAGIRRRLMLLRYCGPSFLASPRLAAIMLRKDTVSRYQRVLRSWTFWKPARRYDLIHAHSGQNGQRLLPLYAAGHLTAPLVVTFHGQDVYGYLRDRPAGFYLPLFRQAAALVVCSDFMRQRLLVLGASADKLHVIPNGIAPTRMIYRKRCTPRSAPLQLLTIGRLVPVKGIEHLISALTLAPLQALDLCLHVVGDGPLLDTLRTQAATAGLGVRVVFHGACAREQVLTLLDRSDLYVAPAVVDADGHAETQGIAVLEAMACGLPVIASNVGGIPETLGAAAAALVAPADPLALATAIARWAGSDDPDGTLSLRGRLRVEQCYPAAAWITALEALYSQLSVQTQ